MLAAAAPVCSSPLCKAHLGSNRDRSSASTLCICVPTESQASGKGSSLIALLRSPQAAFHPTAHRQGSSDFLLPDAVGTLLRVLELSASFAPPPLCPWDSVIGCTERPFLFSPFGLPSSSTWGPRHLFVAPFSLALSFHLCSCSEGSACAELCHLSRELRQHLPGLRVVLPERPRAVLERQASSVPQPVPSRTFQGLPRFCTLHSRFCAVPPAFSLCPQLTATGSSHSPSRVPSAIGGIVPAPCPLPPGG